MLDAGIQSTFTEHVSNPLMSSAPVGISPRVYLQGSILAPVLFLFYINNLTSLFIDDAVIALFVDTSQFSPQLAREKMPKLLPSQ